MYKLALSTFAVVVLCCASIGCDKKEDAAKPASSGTTTAASAAPGAAAKPGNPAVANANDPVVCCKFGGVKGSSTKKLCEDGKGTVVPDAECPTLKK
jgi:hypothetical protein